MSKSDQLETVAEEGIAPAKRYGFTVGDIVETRVPVGFERDFSETEERTASGYPTRGTYPAGTRLRIVAITPKVRLTRKQFIFEEPTRYDAREYFYNAVLESQTSDYEHRVREHFVTIKKPRKRRAVSSDKK